MDAPALALPSDRVHDVKESRQHHETDCNVLQRATTTQPNECDSRADL